MYYMDNFTRNIARHMQAGNTSKEIQLRQICHFFRADPAYGIGAARALGIDLGEFMPHGPYNSKSYDECRLDWNR